jgi:CRP/FNR family transcriptional regulator, cyclic AMP receptor protein
VTVSSADLHKLIRTMLGTGLTYEEADQIAKATVPVSAEAGTLIFSEGDSAEGLMLLAAGTVEVLRTTHTGRLQSVAVVEAPTVLGEMSLLLDRDHTASVRAQTHCELHQLTKTQFTRLLQSESLAAYKLIATIAAVLAHRLQRMDDKVVELSGATSAPAVAPVEELTVFKQKLFSEWSF